MSTLELWTLPLNQPNPLPLYLQFLSPERGGRLFYTKYIVDVIGEIAPAKLVDNVREWQIPAMLKGAASTADPAGIVWGPRAHIWFACQSANRLMELDPSTGLMTAYFGAQFPFPSPRHLMFDRLGRTWYTGSGSKGALVGVFERSTTTATYWDLPIEFLTPEGLWVEETGKIAWLTPINPNQFLTGAFLGRLDTGSGILTGWFYPPPGKRPVNAGVIGDRPAQPENVWFTYGMWGPSSRVFRLDQGKGVIHEYGGSFTQPRRIALDDQKNAWISDWTGKVDMVPAGSSCGTIALPTKQFTVKATTMQVRAREQLVRPKVHSVTPTIQPVRSSKYPCWVEYQLPSLMSQGIQASVPQPGATEIYFTQGGGIMIGRLRP